MANEIEQPNNDGYLSPEQIKAMIGILLTKKYGNYQAALQQLKTAVVAEDNIEEVQKMMRNINSFEKTVDEHRKDMKEKPLNYGRIIDAAHKEFIEPFVKEKNEIQAKLNAVAKIVADKAAKEASEKAKKAELITRLNQFILDYSVKIASATTNAILLDIERVINLEKGRKDVYGDMLPMLVERCNDLTEKIKQQKDLVKEREAVEKAKSGANDAELEKLLEKEAEIDSKIQDNTVFVQEIASNNLIITDNSLENTIEAPKARRTTWKAEIVDAATAVKKAKDMLDIILNAEAVRQSITTLKGAGAFTGKEELIVNGIRYYLSQTF